MNNLKVTGDNLSTIHTSKGLKFEIRRVVYDVWGKRINAPVYSAVKDVGVATEQNRRFRSTMEVIHLLVWH